MRTPVAAMVLLVVMSMPAGGLAGGETGEPADTAGLLPESIGGYVPQDQDGVYTYETLFDLIDGGAEVYRSFNVRLVVSRRYGKSGAPDIFADVFDMGSSRDAFGAYHHDLREGEEAGIGQESEHVGGALYFWKDRYFVSIVGFDEGVDTQRAVLELGRKIAGRIPRRGAKPSLVRMLPGQGMHATQVSYFHDWAYLSTRYFLADRNLLDLGRDTEGILARYRDVEWASGKAGAAPFVILLVRYPSEARARRALGSFLAGYLPEADPHGVARRRDGKWAGASIKGEVIVAVLEAAEQSDIRKIVAEVEAAPAP